MEQTAELPVTVAMGAVTVAPTTVKVVATIVATPAPAGVSHQHKSINCGVTVEYAPPV